MSVVAGDRQEGDKEDVILIQEEDTNQILKKNSGASSVAKSPEIVLLVWIIIFMTHMVSIVTIIAVITNSLAVNGPPIWLEHFWVDLKQSAASVGATIYILKTNKNGLSKDQSIW